MGDITPEHSPQQPADQVSRNFIERLIGHPLTPIVAGVGVPGVMQYYGVAPNLLTPESVPAWSALAGFISSFARDFVKMPLSEEPLHRAGDVFGRMLPRGIVYGLTCAGISAAINFPSINKIVIQATDAAGRAITQARDSVQDFIAQHPIKWPEFMSTQPFTDEPQTAPTVARENPNLDSAVGMGCAVGLATFAILFKSMFEGRNLVATRLTKRK